jgi:tRNA 2-thiocytidine biosynthesis protein TtcA
MSEITDFNKNYGKWFINAVLHAIKKYHLIDPGERICVALSGGKDSATLAFILSYLQRYSHLQFDLSAVHIKTGEYDTSTLKDFCAVLGITYLEDRIIPEQDAPEKSVCSLCARLKRGAIASLLQQHGIRKVAYGHHADDVAETFFMNLVQNQKLGSFSPKVEVNGSSVIIIRPMIYLEEATIQRIHQHLNLPELAWECSHAEKNLRSRYKQGVAQLNTLFHTSGFAKKIVASLENVDMTNTWSELPTE